MTTNATPLTSRPLACMGRYRRTQGSRFWLGLILALLLGPPGRSADTETGPAATVGADPADSAIAGILEPIRAQFDLPALAGAVVTSRGVVACGSVGVRKRGTSVAIGPQDLWHLGSDTKAMTAALIGRWVERGKLRWDSTVSEIFPDLAASFHPDFKEVTLLQLLSHRAGVRANLDWRSLAREGSVPEQRIEAVRQGLSVPPEQPPASKYLYSNLSYVIAGAMLERVAGVSWEQAMRSDLFEPLGMTSAGFGGLGTPGLLDQPWGHRSGGQPMSNNGPSVDNAPVLGPAGTVHATVQDWAKFVADQLRGARGQPGLLRPETYRALFAAPFSGDYALGWQVMERSWGGGTVFNHCGCNTMFYANAWLAPQHDFAVLVCANQGLDAFEATDAAVVALVNWHRKGCQQ